MASVAPAVSKSKKLAHPGSQSQRMKRLEPLLWLAPAVILYLVFKILPLVAGLYLSVLDWNGIDAAKFVGPNNYLDFFSDELVGQALLNNVLYAIGTVTGKIVLSLFLALLLNQALRGRSVYRTALFMPVVMSFVVVSILWAWLYNPQF